MRICQVVLRTPRFILTSATTYWPLLLSFRNAYFVVGDLNSKHGDWNCTTNNTAGTILQDVSANNNFFVEHPPTHTYCPMSIYKAPSTIDLLLTNHKVNLTSILSKQIFSSDHIPVICKADMCIDYIRVLRFNYRLADWNKFRNLINSELDTIMLSPINNPVDIDNLLTKFQEIVIKAQNESVPKQHSGSDGLFLDPHTKFLISIRNVFRRRYLRYFDPLDNEISVNNRNLINNNLKNLRNARWEKKLADCDSNHTEVFKLAKSLKRKSSSMPILNGNVTGELEKAQLIAETFHKITKTHFKTN